MDRINSQPDPRASGVYCDWVQIFENSPYFLKIERVNGNGTVTQLLCTQQEAGEILRHFIDGS